MKKMNKYKLVLMKKEFTFLNNFYGPNVVDEINDIKIKRVDKNLLKQKGYVDTYTWSGGGYCNFIKYFTVELVANDGEKNIIELDNSERSAMTDGGYNNCEADIIGEQLLTKGINPDYLVEYTMNDTDANGNGEVTSFLTIYKMNKFNLVEYHKQQIDKAASELKAEIAVVCSQ